MRGMVMGGRARDVMPCDFERWNRQVAYNTA